MEAIDSRESLERDQERFLHDIAVNEQELQDLKAGKKTLKQFFARNKEQMAADLAIENQKNKEEVEALRTLNLMAAEITVDELAKGYRKRREELWRKAWKIFAGEEEEASRFL